MGKIRLRPIRRRQSADAGYCGPGNHPPALLTSTCNPAGSRRDWSCSKTLKPGILDAVSGTSQPEFLIPPVRIDGQVSLAEPDPAWANWYVREEDRIRHALGERAVQIEHVGSTSVPGLAAKPVIDIVLVVTDSADEATYVPDLETAGYRLKHREPSWHEHRFFGR